MTIQDLQYFLAVYEQRSMTKAADKLFISQPAVSIAVRNLEKEFNTSLFVRNTPLEPTAEGDKLYALAVKFLHSYENLRMEMNNGEYEKPLRIGVSMIVNQLLPADWLNTGNKVSFLGFYDSDFLTQSVLNNTLDLAIVLTVGKFHHAQLRAKTILDTTVSLYTTKENKLSSFKKLRPDQVNNQQVIAFSERAMVEDEYAGIMEKILGDDAHLKVSFYSVNLLNIEKSIAEGNYSAILLSGLFKENKNIISVPIEIPKPVYISVICQKDHIFTDYETGMINQLRAILTSN